MAAKKKTAKKKTAKKKTEVAASLPNIGKPATRALAAVGVTRLDQVTRFTEAELLDLHGVGPKAVGILRSALKASGKSFER